jgi:hypothetical protein
MNIFSNQANSELLQQIMDSHKSGATVYTQQQIIDLETIRFEDAMSANNPPSLMYKREQVIDVEPISFEDAAMSAKDAMTANDPPSLVYKREQAIDVEPFVSRTQCRPMVLRPSS